MRAAKPCPRPGCPQLQPCERHRSKYQRTPEKTRLYRSRYASAEYKRFKQAVLNRAGGKCEVIVKGRRCNSTDRVQPHHRVPLEDGGSHSPSNGLAACLKHHRAIERVLRRKRRERFAS